MDPLLISSVCSSRHTDHISAHQPVLWTASILVAWATNVNSSIQFSLNHENHPWTLQPHRFNINAEINTSSREQCMVPCCSSESWYTDTARAWTAEPNFCRKPDSSVSDAFGSIYLFVWL